MKNASFQYMGATGTKVKSSCSACYASLVYAWPFARASS